MVRADARRPANADLLWRIALQPPEEAGRGGLAEITGAGIDFAGPRGAVGQFQGDARSNGGGVARGSAQLDSKRMVSNYALVEEGKAGRVVSRHDKIRPAILIEIHHGQRLGIAGNDQTAFEGRNTGKMSLAIAAQQLAEAAVETTDNRSRGVGILHRINICVAVAVKIARDDSLQGRDLGEARKRFDSE